MQECWNTRFVTLVHYCLCICKHICPALDTAKYCTDTHPGSPVSYIFHIIKGFYWNGLLVFFFFFTIGNMTAMLKKLANKCNYVSFDICIFNPMLENFDIPNCSFFKYSPTQCPHQMSQVHQGRSCTLEPRKAQNKQQQHKTHHEI